MKPFCHHYNKRSAWKNERSEDNKAYVPTNKEHLANILTHGVSEPSFHMIYMIYMYMMNKNNLLFKVLVPPALWLSLLMYWGATTPTQQWYY